MYFNRDELWQRIMVLLHGSESDVELSDFKITGFMSSALRVIISIRNFPQMDHLLSISN